jgi:hypothetical protein
VKPFDPLKSNLLKQRLLKLIEDEIAPLDDNQKDNRASGKEVTYEKLIEEVKGLQGLMLVKEYHQSLNSFTLHKTREAFATLIENGDYSLILPIILKTEESRQKFSMFIKISFNEAKKNSNVNSKTFLSLIKKTIGVISKQAA